MWLERLREGGRGREGGSLITRLSLLLNEAIAKICRRNPWKKNEVGLERGREGGSLILRLSPLKQQHRNNQLSLNYQLLNHPPRGQSLSYLGSATKQPTTPSKPRLCAAMAAQAMVLTLLGARGHKSRTGPVSGKVRTIIILILVSSHDLFFFTFTSSTF